MKVWKGHESEGSCNECGKHPCAVVHLDYLKFRLCDKCIDEIIPLLQEVRKELYPKTAEKRGMEMMLIPMGELPTLAIEFGKHLCKEFGGCGEVLITAYAVYAQCVEGLPCTDDNYRARPQDKEWFEERCQTSSD